MTKDIGSGTRNTSLNLLEEEYRILNKIVFDRNLSLAEFIRGAVRFRIAHTDPDAAKKLARIRRERLKSHMPAIRRGLRAVACIALTVAHTILVGGEMRRPGRRIDTAEIEEICPSSES